MINGFEDITYELNAVEKAQVKHFVNGFNKRIGSRNAVTSTQIVKGFKKNGMKMTAVRVRKIVNYIRVRGLVPRLVASSKGYYIENDDEKLKVYLHSLRQRMSEISKVHAALQEQMTQEPSNLPYKD